MPILIKEDSAFRIENEVRLNQFQSQTLKVVSNASIPKVPNINNQFPSCKKVIRIYALLT